MANETVPVPTTQAGACPDCGFGLYNLIDRLGRSSIGLYDDARFPGRCIVALNQHFDHLEDVPPDITLEFFMDVRHASLAIRAVTGCERVNVAVLGNTESHVHAHLIPRYPAREALPHKSPWNDPRPHEELPTGDRDSLMARIRAELAGLRENPVRT